MKVIVRYYTANPQALADDIAAITEAWRQLALGGKEEVSVSVGGSTVSYTPSSITQLERTMTLLGEIDTTINPQPEVPMPRVQRYH